MTGAGIRPIEAPNLIGASQGAGSNALRSADKGSFASLLESGLERLQELDAKAESEVNKLFRGEPVELHRVVMAGEEAALGFELLASIRNKVVDAYQEVMRMQV